MRGKTKILHAYKSFYPDLFGGIPYVVDIVSRLDQEKFEQSILVTSATSRGPEVRDGVLIERAFSWGDLLSLPVAPFYPFKLWLRSRKADLIVLHAPFPLADIVLGLFLGRRKKLIVYWHSHVISQKRAYKFIKPLLLRTLKRADCIILSHPSLSYDGSILEPFSAKISIIPYAVDTQTFKPSMHPSTSCNANPRIVACGRLVKYKGFDVLIEAARFIDAEIVIVGEGIERAALVEQISTAGLSHRVKLIGNLPQADLIELMSSTDIFAFPSVSAAETFGIAQIEAMACGCAIVNTHIPTAVPDVARHDIEAITIQPNDAGALARAINLLLDNTAMRKRLSTNARARAVALYDQRNYELKLSSLLSRVSKGDSHDG